MASSLITRLLPHHRHLSPTADTLFASSSYFFPSSYSSSKNTSLLTKQYGRSNSYHTSPTLHRPGYKPERNPKIKITLEQLRMAARTQGRRLPICHEQQEKVMNSLEAAKYENHAIYKYVKEYEKCREDYELNHKGKDKALMKELNKYLVRDRKK